jgi:hypothetical protein
MKPTADNNFCRVFELPEQYPPGFCFGGGTQVQMLMVDWFIPWPHNPKGQEPLETWVEVVDYLLPWLAKKSYVKPGRRYILVTDFGESLMFGGDL